MTQTVGFSAAILLAAENAEVFNWERLSGLSGAAVLAIAVVGFLSGRIVAGFLYREAIADRDRWSQRADDSTKLLQQSVDANEKLTEQVRVLTEQVRVLLDQVKDLKETLIKIASERDKGA